MVGKRRPRGVSLLRWDASFNVGETLRDGFLGRMSDLTITRLPVSQEDLEARLPRTQLRAQDVSEIVLTVQLRSSGRAPLPATLRLMLAVYTNPSSSRDAIVKMTWKRRVTGAEEVESVRAQAAAARGAVESSKTG